MSAPADPRTGSPASDRGGFAFIRLDRPERGNSLSRELVASLRLQLQDALADPAVHTVGFVGDGRHFCTGFDMDALESTSDAELLQRLVDIELLLDSVWRSPVRTVAFGRGKTWGAGADLLAACDIRIATPEAEFRFPGARFGLVLGTHRLAERVGAQTARRLTADGISIGSRNAIELRLIEAIVEDASEAALRAYAGVPAADRATTAALREATAVRLSDASLAALVRSAAVEGLGQRMQAYRAAQAGRRGDGA